MWWLAWLQLHDRQTIWPGRGRRRRGKRQAELSGAELVGDCEAFLAGHLVERLDREGVPVPAWAWTNLLAHGSVRDLKRSAADHVSNYGEEWRNSRSYLAAQVLDLSREYGSLAELQRDVIIPLELSLGSLRDAADWGPSQWEAHVVEELDRHRRPAAAS